MSVSTGRQFLAIPGPTNIPDEVLSAMHRPAVDIYSGGLPAITESCLRDLRNVFQTEGRSYIYAANGHGAWQAALSNTLSPGDAVLVLDSGRFASAWGDVAGKMGIDVSVLPGSYDRAVDPAAVTARLREDLADRTSANFKAILVVQIDTASGVVNDIPAIRAAIDASGHDAMLFVDVIASLGTMPFQMDDWGVDLAVGGAQKGLMTPPGLSFNAAGPKAIAAHAAAKLRTHYWDWTEREGPEHYQRYCGTPPEHLVFALRQALDMLLAEGLGNIYERHRILAGATRAAVSAWSKGGALSFNIAAEVERSNSVTTVLMDEAHGRMLNDYCRETCNVVLGVGIGALAGKSIRIAHMGYVNAPMMLGTLGVVEMGLQALDIPHGKGGVAAAIDYLAREVPDIPQSDGSAAGSARSCAPANCCG